MRNLQPIQVLQTTYPLLPPCRMPIRRIAQHRVHNIQKQIPTYWKPTFLASIQIRLQTSLKLPPPPVQLQLHLHNPSSLPNLSCQLQPFSTVPTRLATIQASLDPWRRYKALLPRNRVGSTVPLTMVPVPSIHPNQSKVKVQSLPKMHLSQSARIEPIFVRPMRVLLSKSVVHSHHHHHHNNSINQILPRELHLPTPHRPRFCRSSLWLQSPNTKILSPFSTRLPPKTKDSLHLHRLHQSRPCYTRKLTATTISSTRTQSRHRHHKHCCPTLPFCHPSQRVPQMTTSRTTMTIRVPWRKWGTTKP